MSPSALAAGETDADVIVATDTDSWASDPISLNSLSTISSSGGTITLQGVTDEIVSTNDAAPDCNVDIEQLPERFSIGCDVGFTRMYSAHGTGAVTPLGITDLLEVAWYALYAEAPIQNETWRYHFTVKQVGLADALYEVNAQADTPDIILDQWDAQVDCPNTFKVYANISVPASNPTFFYNAGVSSFGCMV